MMQCWFAYMQIVDNLVLRVPVLYGIIESLSESAVTTLFSEVLARDVPCQVNNVQLRYPTHCDDVAVVIRQLIDKRCQVCFLKSSPSVVVFISEYYLFLILFLYLIFIFEYSIIH